MKAYFVSLGCPKNTVDMEGTISLLQQAGHEMTDDPRAADLLLVNACSFIRSAWDETAEEVERLSAIKREEGSKKLVLMGCLPKHRTGKLEDTMQDVDCFISAGRHASLAEVINSWRLSGSREESSGAGAAESYDPFSGLEGRMLLTPGHTAFVKIAEGCDHTCDFCAIPKIRGPFVSRDGESIKREVAELAARGVKEISLIAQDPAAYKTGGMRLPDLVESLALADIEWIRILYVHPSSIRVDDLKRVFEIPAVCRYLDIAVQHASDRILSRMGRGYTRKYLERLFTGIRSAFPDMVLRTEIIVGYPGETDEDFEILKDFITAAGFSTLGIFSFSPEPGTPAFSRPESVPPEVKEERYAELVSLQESVAFDLHSALIGQEVKVLVDRKVGEQEDVHGACKSAGRYYGQALEIDGEFYLRGGELQPGRFVSAEIIDADSFDLLGEVRDLEMT